MILCIYVNIKIFLNPLLLQISTNENWRKCFERNSQIVSDTPEAGNTSERIRVGLAGGHHSRWLKMEVQSHWWTGQTLSCASVCDHMQIGVGKGLFQADRVASGEPFWVFTLLWFCSYHTTLLSKFTCHWSVDANVTWVTIACHRLPVNTHEDISIIWNSLQRLCVT